MPISTEQFLNVNTTTTKRDGSTDDNVQAFDKVLKASQSSKEVSSSVKGSKNPNEKVDMDLEKEAKDLIESEDTTVDELILVLLNIYMNNSDINKVQDNTIDYSTSNYDVMDKDFLQDISALELGNNNSKAYLHEMVENLLSTEKLPAETVEIFQQYLKVSAENSETLTEDFSGYISIDTINPNQANISEENALKNRIIDQIKNLVDVNESDDQVYNTILEPVALVMDETVSTDIRKNKTEDKVSSTDIKEGKNLEAYELKPNNYLAEISKFKVVNSPKESNSTSLMGQEKKPTNDSYVVEKEDAFLKGMLEDNQKGEGKINLFMNYLRVDKNVQEPIQTQSEVVVNRVTFVNDIIKSVKFMETSNLKELKVSINPKEIGELLITVTMESGKMKANIEANSKESYKLLMTNLDDIKKAMGSNEVKLQDINVSINQGDTTFFKDSSQRQEKQNESSDTGLRVKKLSIDEDVDITETLDTLNDSQINMLA